MMSELNNYVSVLIPIYNKAIFLEQCIESVIKSSYSLLDIILVDDGSTDDSLQICKAYAEKDERIRVISKKNGGVSSARNAGIESSIGEYVTFVDPDDTVEKDMLEKLMQCIQQYEADISYCYALDHFENHEITASNKTGQARVIDNGKYDWLSNDVHEVCWGAVYRKSVIANNKFKLDLVIGEDTLFFAECIKNANRIVSLDLPLYNYYHNEYSVTSGSWNVKKNDELRAREMICQLFKKTNIEKSARAACAVVCKVLVRKYCNDEIFVKDACLYYRKKYRKYAIDLFIYQMKKKQFLEAVKTIYIFLFWYSYVHHQSKK